MHGLAGHDYTVARGWRIWGAVCVALSLISGLVYLVVEFRTACAVRDVPLVGVVIFNAVAVYATGWLLAPRLGRMIEGFPAEDMPVQDRLDHVLFAPGSLVLAVVCGVVVAGGLYLFDPWARDVLSFEDLVALVGASAASPTGPAPAPNCTPPIETLNRLLAIFVFCGNLIIGAAVAAILRVWWLVLTRLDTLDLRILNLSHPPLPPLLRANSLIVTATAMVASLSIMSLVLSGYEIDAAIAVYSLTALVLVALTYAVPMLPLSNRLMVLKSAELDAVERRIEARVRALSGHPQRGEIDVDALPPLDALLETRKTIAGIQTLPPGGQVSVSAAGIVAALSFMPTLIDYLVN